MLGVVAVGLAFLRAVDAVEADAFRAAVVQDFEGVAVENGKDLAKEVGGDDAGDNQEAEDIEERPGKRAQGREPPYALSVSRVASYFCLRDRCPTSAHRPKAPATTRS
jgi:hypothetical protein